MNTKLSLILLVLAAAPLWSADTLQIDPVHTTALFRVQHFGAGQYIGRINDATGTITFDAADPSKNAIEVELKAENIDTHNEKRDQHLKSPDFFNAKQFPVITFKSKSAKKSDDTHFELTGDLTLLGVTKEISVSVEVTGQGKDPGGNTRVGFESSFAIKRSDFGMKGMVGPVGDDVRIIIGIEAIKKKE